MRVYKKLRKAGYTPLAAWLIYKGVRVGGGNHFNYKDPPDPREPEDFDWSRD